MQKERGLDGASPLDIAIILKKGVDTAGRGTYTIGSSASLRWVGGDCQQHAHPRILLPQNRCLPHLLAVPFPHQPEPRCNTLDFTSKVVCQRAFRRSLDSSRQGTEEMNVQIANWSISKEKYRSRSAAMILSGESAAKLIGCVAGR